MSAPVPYDFIAAIEDAAPGIVVQREMIDAVADAWEENGRVALTAETIIALVGPLPDYPTGLPRWPDQYGGMPDPRGWTRLLNDKVVRGGP